MMREYPTLRAEGLGPADIAKQFGFSSSYVRNILGEIADMHGVSRESLLLFPHNISDEGLAALVASAKKPRKRKPGLVTETTESEEFLTKTLEPETDEVADFDAGARLIGFAAEKERINIKTQRAAQSVHDRVRNIEKWRDFLCQEC